MAETYAQRQQSQKRYSNKELAAKGIIRGVVQMSIDTSSVTVKTKDGEEGPLTPKTMLKLGIIK